MKKEWKIFLNLMAIAPIAFYISIGSVFHFGGWWQELLSEYQLRILAGSIFMVIFFLLYYVSLYIFLFRNYHEQDRRQRLGMALLAALLAVVVFLVSLFATPQY